MAMSTACQVLESSSLKNWQGLYKYTFANSFTGESEHTSENRLLLMQVSSTTAYFETHLEWANGHSCDLSGIAFVTSRKILTYSEPSILGKTCTFNINFEENKFVFDDNDGACRLIACGSRGLLDGVEFQYGTRREITPELIKKTPVYIRAIKKQ